MLDVRSAVTADCDDIYRVHVAAIRALPGGTQGKDAVERWLTGQGPSAYSSSMGEESLIVGLLAGVVVAWGALSIPKQEITHVFVDPQHHRKRFGTAIIDRLESMAGEAGIEGVQLQATGTAIDFYVARGYRAAPPVAPGTGWALMKKRLD